MSNKTGKTTMSTAINQVRCGVTRIASVSWASCIHPAEKLKKGNLKLSQLNKAKHDERKSRTAKKQGTVIIGDSMVKGLHQHKLVNSVNQNIRVKCFAGATVVDMSDYIKPVLRRKPVLHVGTNDTDILAHSLLFVPFNICLWMNICPGLIF